MRKAGFIIFSIAVCLHLLILFSGQGGISAFGLGLFVWALLPYIPCLLILINKKPPIISICGALPPLVLDFMAYRSVFISPQSSTAALILLWMPLWNMIGFMPAGVIVGIIIYVVTKRVLKKKQKDLVQ